MLTGPDSQVSARIEAGILDPPPLEMVAEAPVPEAPVHVPVVPNARATAGSRWRLHTAVWFGSSFFAIFVAIVSSGLGANTMAAFMGLTGLALFGLSSLIAAYRSVRGFVELVRGAREPPRPETAGVIVALIGNLFMTGLGAWVAYMATFGFSRGRQLRRLGRVLLPPLRPNPNWTTAVVDVAGHDDPPAGLADQWRENGKTEHASVAAFARLTLDLMALGAPPSLIAASNQDALDEIRHTELCFSVAQALDGKSVSPGPFPQAQRVATLPRMRTLALAKLAVDSLIDGALHEGVSARIIAKLAQRCQAAGMRAALKGIAADEGRHAAHGWAVVGWCLDEGGQAVAQALHGALRLLPAQMRSELPVPASDGGWERWGIHGHSLEAQEYAAARAYVIRRVQALTAGLSSRAA